MANAIKFSVPISLPVDPSSPLHAATKQYVDNGLSSKANLASPEFSGAPLVPTAPVGTNTTQIASTAYTVAEIASRAPGKTGLGASGSWAIDITGTAGNSTQLNGQAASYYLNLANSTGTLAIARLPAFTGDVTTVAGAATTTIANNVVTLAKLATMATASFLGRNTANTGNVEVLSVATAKTMLGLTGTNSGDQTITLTGHVTGTGTGSFATTIAAGVITNAMQANMPANTLSGNNTGSPAAPSDLTPAQVRTLLNVADGATANVGTVTSVALSLPSMFTVSGSPVTTNGTLTATLASQAANSFFAAPSGSAGAPVFRAIVAADIPTLNQNTTGSAASLTTARTIALSGIVTGTATSFNGTANITIPVTAVNVADAGITGILATDHGGTGLSSFTTGSYLRAASSNTLEERTIAQLRSDVGATRFTMSSTPPAGPNGLGDRWLNDTNGVEYTYLDDGDSAQWVDLRTPVVSGPATHTFVQAQQPSSTDPYVWYETGLGSSGEDISIWINIPD